MATVNLQVGADADDGWSYNDSSYGNYTQEFVWLGGYYGNGEGLIGGFRFQNVTVPAGSTITSAVLSLYGNGKEATPDYDMAFDIYCDDVDSSTGFTDYPDDSGYPAAKTKTTNKVDWDFSSSTWDASWHDSPNIGNGANSPVGEVLGRVGWTSGNALTVLVWHTGSVEQQATINAEEYGDSTTLCAKLSITYTEATLTKDINGLARASVKTIENLAIASVKNINGLA